MSNINKDQTQLNKDSVFRTEKNTDLNTNLQAPLQANQNAPQIQRSKPNSDLLANAPEKNITNDLEQNAANEAYLDRIIENSVQKNRALKVRQDRMLTKDGFVNVVPEKICRFRQQYPTAKKDKLFGSSENALIKRCKKTFRNADLNTAREYYALEAYFKQPGYTSDPVGEGAKDEILNNDLKQYVDDLIDHSIDYKSLTEDYLSKHICEVYKFSWKLSKYNELKAKYPKFFNNIPETKKISLERMAAASEALDDLLKTHLTMHGINITVDENGSGVSLIKESADKTERHLRRRQLKTEYDRKYNEFMENNFAHKDTALAKQFLGNKFINESADLINILNETFGDKKEVTELFGPQVKTAMEEIKKTLAVRDQLLGELKTNYSNMAMDVDGSGDLRRALRHTNAKLLLCSAHIDNYKQYLYFLNGDVDSLPKDTVDFLAREKHEDLLEPVKFKAKLDCVEEAIALKDYIVENEVEEDEKSAKNVKKNDSTVKRPFFKAPEKISKEKFYAKRREYYKAVKESEEYKKLIDDWKKVKEDTLKRAAQYAKDNNLVKTDTRFALNFYDPKSEYLKGDDFFWITVAGNYKPTDKTPKKAVEEIRDKGVKPWVDKVLALKPEEYKDIALDKDDDPLKPGYFEKLAIFELGWDAKSFSNVMNYYGLDLTDEQFLKISTFSMNMGDYSAQMDYINEKMQIPFLKVIGNDERIASVANVLTDNVFSNSNNKEVAKFLERHEKNATGIELHDEQLIKGNKKDATVPVYLDNILSPLAYLDFILRYSTNDYKKQLEDAKKRAEKEHGNRMHHTRAAQEKKRIADAGFLEMSDAQIDIRLWLKDYYKRQNPIPIEDDAQKAAFKKAFGTRTEGAASLKNFRKTQHYVELDGNDTVRSAYRAKAYLNKMDLEEYTAGGDGRQKYLKRKVNDILSYQPVLMKHFKELAALKDDQKRLEYMTAHFRELNEMNQIMQGFKAIAFENADYLNSDAIPADKREAFRQQYTHNPLVDTLNRILESFAESLGMKATGEELPQPSYEKENEKEKKKSEADRKKALKEAWEAKQKNALATMNALLKDDLAKDLKTYESYEKLMKEKPEMVRKIAFFEEKIRLKNEEYIRRKKEYDALMAPLISEQKRVAEQMDKEEDPQKRENLKKKRRENSTKIAEIQGQYNGISDSDKNVWTDRSVLAREMKDHLFGLKDTISDEALLFAEQNGFAEYFKQEDIDSAALRIEKKKVMEAYGYPVPEGADPAVKAKTEREIRELLDLKNGEDIEKALEEVAKAGVEFKKAAKGVPNSFSDEDSKKLEKRFGSKVTDNEDLRCFEFLFEPVRRDIFGNPLPGYEKNAEENSKIVEDYISGNETRVKSVLRKMADKVLKLDISEEKMTDEYFRAHPREIAETVSVLHNFNNYYQFKKDFFTGDAFTTEEQDDLRRKGETGAGKYGTGLISDYMQKLGYDGRNLNGQKGAIFRTIAGTYKTEYKNHRDEYKAYVEKEKAAPPEKSRQITKLDHIIVKAGKLGLRADGLNKVMLIADGKAKKLNDSDRKDLAYYFQDIKEVEARKYKTVEAKITGDEVREFLGNYPQFDKKSAEKVLHICQNAQANSERVRASDELYENLVEISKKEEKDKSLEGIKEDIKAYTDRLLSLKLDETTLNEEYISENINLFVEYTRAHELLSHIQKHYPELLDSLPLRDRVSIMYRQQNYKSVKTLVDAYLKKEGLKSLPITEEIDGVNCWTDWGITPINEIKPSKADKERRKSEFDKALGDAKEANRQQEKARMFIAKSLSEGFDSKEGNACVKRFYDYNGIEKSLQKNDKVYKNCKPCYDRILKQYRNDADSIKDYLYNAQEYADAINETTEFINKQRAVLEQQESLKASGSTEYNAEIENRVRNAIKDAEYEIQAQEGGLGFAADKARTLLARFRDLEKYHELFRMGTGEGGLISKETEDFLAEKGLSEEYGLILTNIILSKTKIDDYADPVFESQKRRQMAKENLEKHKESILDTEQTWALCQTDGYYKAPVIRDSKIKAYMEGLSKLAIEFNEHTLSDEYIAEHLGEFYEYMRAFSRDHFEIFRKYDVNHIFDSLSREEQEDILKRLEYCENVTRVVEAFQVKYGIHTELTTNKSRWKYTLFIELKNEKGPVLKAEMAEIQNKLDDARSELLDIVKKEKEEQKEKEEAARKEKETVNSESPWTEEEEKAFAVMPMEELMGALKESEERGADPEIVYKELAKRMDAPVEVVKESYKTVLDKEKEEEKAGDNQDLSAWGDLSADMIQMLAETEGISPEEYSKKHNIGVEKKEEKKEEKNADGDLEESNALELSEETIKELADFEGMSVEDFKKKEGVVSKEDKERIREEKRRAEEKAKKEKEEKAKKEEEEKAKKAEEERAKRAEQDRKEEEERKRQEEEEISKIEEEFKKLEREALEKEAGARKDEYALPQHEAEPQRAEGIRFEMQTTNNCWCCCGTFIFNQFNGLNKIKGKGLKVYNQKDMRNYVPNVKTLAKLKKEGYEEDKKGYDRSVAELKEYAGKGKTSPGNIYEVSDFFLEKRKDIMVHKIVFYTPGTMDNETEEKRSADKEQINKQRESFLNEVKAVLDTGNYVAVNRLYGNSGHYRTITGIKGDKLKCLNPSNGDSPEYLPVSFFLKKYGAPGYGKVELNWLSKKPSKDELLKDYGDKGLTYDEKKKTFVTSEAGEVSMNIGQTLGVNVTAVENQEIGMAHTVYIPKNL